MLFSRRPYFSSLFLQFSPFFPQGGCRGCTLHALPGTASRAAQASHLQCPPQPARPARPAQPSDTRESHFETKLPLQAVRTQKRGVAAKARLAALGQPGAAKLPPLLDFGPYRLRSPELYAAGRAGRHGQRPADGGRDDSPLPAAPPRAPPRTPQPHCHPLSAIRWDARRQSNALRRRGENGGKGSDCSLDASRTIMAASMPPGGHCRVLLGLLLSAGQGLLQRLQPASARFSPHLLPRRDLSPRRAGAALARGSWKPLREAGRRQQAGTSQ